MCSGILICHSSLLDLSTPSLRVQSQVLNHLRCEGAIGGDPITLHALILSGTFARPYERIGAEIALNIGGDNFPGDAFSGLEPLSGRHRRHCE